MNTVICKKQAVCCGQRVPATEEAVQALLTARGLNAAEQAREWIAVGNSLSEPRWMQLCTERAEAMADLAERGQAVLRRLEACGKEALGTPRVVVDAGAAAERQFTWLGESRGTTLSVVRDGIDALAGKGFIQRDTVQKAALRRALGLSVNAAEAGEMGPWVRWMGEGDALNYLVESLWQMGLIGCPGGQRHKWQTLCGAFMRADGRRYEPNIKNNRCKNAYKRQAIDEALLNGLRFVCRPAPAGAGAK